MKIMEIADYVDFAKINKEIQKFKNDGGKTYDLCVTRSTVHRIKNSTISLETLLKVAKATNNNPRDFFFTNRD